MNKYYFGADKIKYLLEVSIKYDNYVFEFVTYLSYLSFKPNFE